MALTQMALDSLDFDATVALAETVAPHVDILEIGTPCIKHNGIKLLETLDETWHGDYCGKDCFVEVTFKDRKE